MANRKAIRVWRATYRNPKASANSSIVIRARAVRVSISSKGRSPLLQLTGPAPSIAYNFCTIGRNRNPYEFELIVPVDPQSPFEAISGQVQTEQFPLRSANGDLFLA